MEGIDQYWKPIVALIASVGFAIATGIGNGEIGDIDALGWIYILALIVGGPAATWFAENILGVAGGYETDNALSQGEILVAVAGFLTTLTLAYQVPGPTPGTAAVVPTAEVRPRAT